MDSPSNKGKIVLVTGANSGVGFEAAHQFAKAGYSKIILGVRTFEKGDRARKQLIERCDKDVFDIVKVDVSEVSSAIKASEELISLLPRL
jgi:NAD(P)-dependent dehydrogenase (short-subunit alcohol dehydrogenase family)